MCKDNKNYFVLHSKKMPNAFVLPFGISMIKIGV